MAELTTEERRAWSAGAQHGRISLAVEILRKETDKPAFLLAMFRRAKEEAEMLKGANHDPATVALFEGYSEGFRHALNVLENHGTALEAYQNIINPGVRLLTFKDNNWSLYT